MLRGVPDPADAASNVVVEIDRVHHDRTRIVAEPLPEVVPPGHVRFRIDRLALTANTVTYAAVGDLLGYWDFYPAEAGWGRVPAMGWADVVGSGVDGIESAMRCFGWFPMAGWVDVEVRRADGGLQATGRHRSAHAPVYRSFQDAASDPWYEPGDDAEDRHALLRGLFLTAFLADADLADDPTIDRVVVLSASSKTAIGLAQRLASRGVPVVGVTAARNVDFVAGLGAGRPFYAAVGTYGDLADVAEAARRDAHGVAIVDLSGDRSVVADLHARLGPSLVRSMVIGFTHHDAPPVDVPDGPTPELFFAPDAVGRRQAEWGADEYAERCAAALGDFVAASREWLGIERVAGPDAVAASWSEARAGAIAPTTGRIISLHTPGTVPRGHDTEEI